LVLHAVEAVLDGVGEQEQVHSSQAAVCAPCVCCAVCGVQDGNAQDAAGSEELTAAQEALAAVQGLLN
jgi:hypothetical protein